MSTFDQRHIQMGREPSRERHADDAAAKDDDVEPHVSALRGRAYRPCRVDSR